MEKINIAIDGLAGSGKSTIAKILAKKLGYTYIDTGSMYRCVAYLMVKNNVDPSDIDSIQDLLKNHYDYQYHKYYRIPYLKRSKQMERFYQYRKNLHYYRRV